jgi:hypothetical protein
LFISSCFAQQYELGAAIGYGAYRNGTTFGPGESVTAGIRNRFAAGAVFGEDLYDHLSGEVRYTYQDGHPFLSGAGQKTDIQGQSQTLTYDVLFHFRDREHRVRPFLAAGLGAKEYVIAGPAPAPIFPGIASLTTQDEWKFVGALGGGVKLRLARHVILRGDFLDYMTTFPKREILPAPGNTARGIFQQFTGLFGVSYTF